MQATWPVEKRTELETSPEMFSLLKFACIKWWISSEIDQNVTKILTQKPDHFLQNGLFAFNRFERLSGAEQRLNRSQKHHADHHDGEDRNGVTRHPHDEHVHRHLRRIKSDNRRQKHHSKTKQKCQNSHTTCLRGAKATSQAFFTTNLPSCSLDVTSMASLSVL